MEVVLEGLRVSAVPGTSDDEGGYEAVTVSSATTSALLRGPLTDQERAGTSTDTSRTSYREARSAFWNRIAANPKTFGSGYYHKRLTEVFQFLVSPESRVLELGCGEGDLLAAIEPSHGVGVDFSKVTLETARSRHPDLTFIHADAHDIDLHETFDVVIISDLVNDAFDVQQLLEVARNHCHPDTRLIVNTFNRLWQGSIALARRLKLAQPMLKQNWLSVGDVDNLVQITGFESISTTGEILWPIRTPLIDAFFNKVLVRIWPFNHMALTHFVVARPHRLTTSPSAEPAVSVIVPARNEAGHIEEILRRTPKMGSNTEILFVEGNSTDDTFAVIKDAVDQLEDPNIRYYRQPGVGKGDAVRYGYSHATGDILMILDADMTVAPEDLPRFYKALADGSGEFINGVRLVYPMEHQAMQFLNYLGNKFFGMIFSWLLKQPVKDTLCGTKVLTRANYERIAANRSYFGDFDPFGDFDLLFGAAKSNLKIIDIPIRYRQREYGDTNISRWRHGVLLLRMAAFAARKLRFV